MIFLSILIIFVSGAVVGYCIERRNAERQHNKWLEEFEKKLGVKS